MNAARLIASGIAAVALAAPATAAADMSAAGVQALEDQGAREIVVRREPGLSTAERADVRADAGVRLVRRSSLPNTEVVRAGAGELSEAVETLERDRDVVYAEPVVVRAATSADTYFDLQWALENTGQWIDYEYPGGTPDADMDVPAAWAESTGAGVTVGIVDTGLLRTHPDLAGHVAVNPGESGAGRESNGVDDDGNGYVDDWQGYDFVVEDTLLEVIEGDATPGADNDPQDNHGHGTHVAGIVAAERDNGQGVAGVAPEANVMPLRALGADGSGTSLAIAEAFDYAGDMGLKIVNASLGGDGLSQYELDAIEAHPDTLYVVAAGNDTSNVDTNPQSPCSLPADNIVCVGAADYDDAPASFSNFGITGVDVFAPGVKIASTYLFDDYAYMDGTSMASPNAAGVAALMLATAPGTGALDLKQTLLMTAEPKAALAGTSVTGARVNAAAAVDALATDSDGDGHSDRHDAFPHDPGEWADADDDGTGDNADTDDDNDGHPDTADRFPHDPGEWADADEDGTGDNADTDDDNDGIEDARDPAPRTINPWADLDHDGVHDLVDDDRDGDGVANGADAFPDDPFEASDSDGDGLGNARDNCPFVANPGQADGDRDRIGDACDVAAVGPPAPPPLTTITRPPVAPPAPASVRITSVRAKVSRRHRLIVRLTANQPVSVRAVVTRRGRAHRSARAHARGEGRLRVRFRKRLARGRYRLKLTAVGADDRARRTLRFRIR